MIRHLIAALGLVAVMGAPVGEQGQYFHRTLTPDGADGYVTMELPHGGLRITAPHSNTSSNLRRVYLPVGAVVRADSDACATWAAFPPTSQPGLAHRVTADTALTITRNVWAGAYWTFNVHAWVGELFETVAQLDFSAVLLREDGSYRPLPWRVCSRLVGDDLVVKVWFLGEDQPDWGDPDRTRTSPVPTQPPGWTGWYVGHLAPGESMTMVGLTS